MDKLRLDLLNPKQLIGLCPISIQQFRDSIQTLGRLAVQTDPHVPLQAIAGPGSGKTKVSGRTRRVVNAESQIKPPGVDFANRIPGSASWHPTFRYMRGDIYQQGEPAFSSSIIDQPYIMYSGSK